MPQAGRRSRTLARTHALGGAMAFDGSAVLLFGGIAELSNPMPRLFGLTWEWDGQHWTARQGIGPAPRWSHALAFDSKRRSVCADVGHGRLGQQQVLGGWQDSKDRPTARYAFQLAFPTRFELKS